MPSAGRPPRGHRRPHRLLRPNRPYWRYRFGRYRSEPGLGYRASRDNEGPLADWRGSEATRVKPEIRGPDCAIQVPIQARKAYECCGLWSICGKNTRFGRFSYISLAINLFKCMNNAVLQNMHKVIYRMHNPGISCSIDCIPGRGASMLYSFSRIHVINISRGY